MLLANAAAALPLARAARVAVVGPLAADPLAFFGCYTLPAPPRAAQHPEAAAGIAVPTVLDALRAELPAAS